MKTKRETPLYEDTARYDFWLNFILGGVVAITGILSVVSILRGSEDIWVWFGITIFEIVLFKAILPRKFQIFPGYLRIVLGGPLAVNLDFANIKQVRPAPARKLFAYRGIRLATSAVYLMEIVRHKGLGLVISPASGDTFLEQLRQALESG